MQAGAKRPVLLLDVMETLVHEPAFVELPAFFGLTPRELFGELHPTSWVEFECGTIDEATLLQRFFRDGRAFDHGGLKACMQAGYRWLEGMESLLGELVEAGCEMHALSNYPPWYRLIEQRLALSRFLRWSFVSCDTGVRKPDRGAYVGAAESLGVSPQECLFIDDRRRNCEAAGRIGAPSRANRIAVARPLPMVSPGVWPAPTTMAFLPSNRMVILPY